MSHPAYLMMKRPPIALGLWIISRAIKKHRFPSLVWRPWRFLGCLLVIALIGFAGCSHMENLTQAKGPLFALNPSHWQATPEDLKAPPQVER